MYRSPWESKTVIPGVTPASLRDRTVNMPVVSGPSDRLAPRRIASADIGAVPFRLVNQAELGTPSKLSTLSDS